MKKFNKGITTLLLYTLFGSIILTSCLKLKSDSNKPNIIFILADDLGYGDIECYGAKDIQTPNINKLSDNGIKLNSLYTTSSVGTPSRAAFITGRYAKRSNLHKGILQPYNQGGLEPKEFTLAEQLKGAGYKTFCAGEWHLGHAEPYMPLNNGFEHFQGVPYSHQIDSSYYADINFQAPPLPYYKDGKIDVSGLNQDSITIRWTNSVVDYILNYDSKSPFFIYMAHSMPHVPWHASNAFKGKSKRGLYGDVIEEIDWSVGEVIKALNKKRMYDNTIVVFTSDNGPDKIGENKNGGKATPFRGYKNQSWEGGSRVPGIISWPGKLPKGKQINEPVTFMDFFPTFSQFAAIPLPDSIKFDGYNISNLLLNPDESSSPYEYMLYHSTKGEIDAIKVGEWKLHLKNTPKGKRADEHEVLLFNLNDDVSESKNIAEKHKNIVYNLKELIALKRIKY